MATAMATATVTAVAGSILIFTFKASSPDAARCRTPDRNTVLLGSKTQSHDTTRYDTISYDTTLSRSNASVESLWHAERRLLSEGDPRRPTTGQWAIVVYQGTYECTFVFLNRLQLKVLLNPPNLIHRCLIPSFRLLTSSRVTSLTLYFYRTLSQVPRSNILGWCA